MPARSFLDSNVLIYTDDASSPGKQRTALDLVAACRRRNEGVVSLQVLQEYLRDLHAQAGRRSRRRAPEGRTVCPTAARRDRSRRRPGRHRPPSPASTPLLGRAHCPQRAAGPLLQALVRGSPARPADRWPGDRQSLQVAGMPPVRRRTRRSRRRTPNGAACPGPGGFGRISPPAALTPLAHASHALRSLADTGHRPARPSPIRPSTP